MHVDVVFLQLEPKAQLKFITGTLFVIDCLFKLQSTSSVISCDV